jgi:predicted TIM-barrel fold metal-dependent hydrolase
MFQTMKGHLLIFYLILFGSDFSAVPFSPLEHIDIVCTELGLSGRDQNKILGGNAVELFDLTK